MTLSELAERIRGRTSPGDHTARFPAGGDWHVLLDHFGAGDLVHAASDLNDGACVEVDLGRLYSRAGIS